MLKTVNYTGNRTRERNLGIRNAVTHSIAGTNSNGYARIAAHLHQFIDKRNNKAVKVRACYVFKVTTRHNARLKSLRNGCEIIIHALFARHLHFFEYMIIGAADKYARFAYSHIADELEVVFRRPYPCGDFGKTKTEFHTFFDGFPILFAVYEKLCLTDYPVRTAEF